MINNKSNSFIGLKRGVFNSFHHEQKNYLYLNINFISGCVFRIHAHIINKNPIYNNRGISIIYTTEQQSLYSGIGISIYK